MAKFTDQQQLSGRDAMIAGNTHETAFLAGRWPLMGLTLLQSLIPMTAHA